MVLHDVTDSVQVVNARQRLFPWRNHKIILVHPCHPFYQQSRVDPKDDRIIGSGHTKTINVAIAIQRSIFDEEVVDDADTVDVSSFNKEAPIMRIGVDLLEYMLSLGVDRKKEAFLNSPTIGIYEKG